MQCNLSGSWCRYYGNVKVDGQVSQSVSQSVSLEGLKAEREPVGGCVAGQLGRGGRGMGNSHVARRAAGALILGCSIRPTCPASTRGACCPKWTPVDREACCHWPVDALPPASPVQGIFIAGPPRRAEGLAGGCLFLDFVRACPLF